MRNNLSILGATLLAEDMLTRICIASSNYVGGCIDRATATSSLPRWKMTERLPEAHGSEQLGVLFFELTSIL
jgi:hypothetical protein